MENWRSPWSTHKTCGISGCFGALLQCNRLVWFYVLFIPCLHVKHSIAFIIILANIMASMTGSSMTPLELEKSFIVFNFRVERFISSTDDCFSGSNLAKRHKKLAGASAFSSFESYVETILSRVKGFQDMDRKETENGMRYSYTACQEYFPHIRSVFCPYI